MSLTIDTDTVLADLRELADRSGGRFAGARRLAWTPEWHEARRWLRTKLDAIGLEVAQDAAGNLWAANDLTRRPFVIVGSHLDAVPEGGWLDGALGVLAALGVMRSMHAASAPPVAVRFVDWADEEGARFGRSLLGSSACAGTLAADEVRDLTDPTGVRLEDALRSCQVDLDAAAAAGDGLDGAAAYVELHIEQGPILLRTRRLAAAVSGTYGVQRHLFSFAGETAHAGSTPLADRRDALAAAAEAILAVREIGQRRGGVCTVGALTLTPGVVTAIPGWVEMSLDQRHLDGSVLARMREEAEGACARAAERHGCRVDSQRLLEIAPTRFTPELVALAREAVGEVTGEAGEAIPSGALHDATEIGRIVPTVMIFAQSDPPISHTRVEDSPEPALRAAIAAYARTVSVILQRVARGQSLGAVC
jgi:hydantoinase/carbamoylase family amidase